MKTFRTPMAGVEDDVTRMTRELTELEKLTTKLKQMKASLSMCVHLLGPLRVCLFGLSQPPPTHMPLRLFSLFRVVLFNALHTLSNKTTQ